MLIPIIILYLPEIIFRLSLKTIHFDGMKHQNPTNFNMKTLTNFAAASGSSILLLLLFLCWSSLQTLQAQTPYDSYYELPEKYSHLLEAGIDLGPGMKEMPAIHRSDEYLVKLDTLSFTLPEMA